MTEWIKVKLDESNNVVETWEPKYTIFGYGFVGLVDFMGDDSSIVRAARVSYGKGTKKTNSDEALIRYLMRYQHNTPFEMVKFTFHVKAPIFVFRQWHRHRTASINEYSARYSEMSDEMYVPHLADMAPQATSNKQGRTNQVSGSAIQHQNTIEEAYEYAFDAYQKLLNKDNPEQGLSRELARLVLPVATYSQMYWSVDLRNLFHFIKLRSDPHAQKEIRVYSDAMLELIKPIVPVAAQAFLDYSKNAVTFSAAEIDVLRQYMEIIYNEERDGCWSKVDYSEMKPKLKEAGLSEREISDFIKKMEGGNHD